MIFTLLLANIVHGFVGLLWVGGLRRVAGPLTPGFSASLLTMALVLPVVILIAQLSGATLPEQLLVVRVDVWASAVLGAVPALGFIALLMVGTMAIVLVQEVLPLLRRHRPHRVEPHPRLFASLARVRASYRQAGLRRPRGRPARVLLLATDRRVAVVHGVVAARIMVSRGLLDCVDDDELDAIVAHELAHLYRGGSIYMVVVWVVRLVQCASPAALIIFRSFIETQEAACDALGARVCGRPGALAEALLKVHRAAPVPTAGGAAQRAWAEVRRRSDLVATRLRVRRLLDHQPSGAPAWPLVWLTAIVMGALLWSIG